MSAEDRPGVYRFYGPDRTLIYVGKSVRVLTRLLSYFRAHPAEKAAEIIANAVDVAWEHVPNEFEALVTEMRLIQRHRPRYNVQHKRKRRYAFVKVTREAAPRVLPVTRVARDGATYYGPFPKVGRVALAVRDLVTTLGLRDCAGSTPVVFGDQLDIFSARASPGPRAPLCLRADLGTCLGPCCGRTEASPYNARVEMARDFLGGRGRPTLKLLGERMREAASRRDFEYAAVLRDRRERLARFRSELTAFRGEVERLTFVYRVPGWRGADRLYLIRAGRVRRVLPHPKSARSRARAVREVEEVYDEPDQGPGGLSAEEAAEVLLVARWFRLHEKELRRTFAPGEWLALKRSHARAVVAAADRLAAGGP